MRVFEDYQKYFWDASRGPGQALGIPLQLRELEEDIGKMPARRVPFNFQPTDLVGANRPVHELLFWHCGCQRRKGKNAAVAYSNIPSSIAPIAKCSKYPVHIPPASDKVQDRFPDEEEDMVAEHLEHLPEVQKNPSFPKPKRSK